MFNRTTNIRFLEILAAIIITIIIVTYIIWRSLNYIRGPEIVIYEPANGSEINSNYFQIKGQAYRINNLFLNGNPLMIDEFGRFNKDIGTLQGVNLLFFNGKDRFGRSTTKSITLMGKITNSSSDTTESTSTTASSTTTPSK